MQLRRARGPVVDSLRFATLFLMAAGATSTWAQVIVPPIKPPVVKPQPAPPKPAEVKLKGPTTIEAQSIEGVPDLEVTARGQVELKRDDITIYSEMLRYNQEFGWATASSARGCASIRRTIRACSKSRRSSCGATSRRMAPPSASN